MTNPYLSAAQEITGQDLQSAYQGSSGAVIPKPPTQQRPKKAQSGLKQRPTLRPRPRNVLPQRPVITTKQLGEFGALSGFSKIRKMVFLAAIGAGFAASKLFLNKYEVLLLAEKPEYRDLKRLIPKAEKVLLPATGLFAFPVALALFSDQEWPMLAWLCWLGAVAFILKEAGSDIVGIIKDTKSDANAFKAKKLKAARRHK